MSIDFLLTSLIVVVSPGTGALYTISTGLSQGGRAGALAAFGCALGAIPHMLAAITGLAALFHASASAFEIAKYLGAGWLLYMAANTLKKEGALRVGDAPQRRSALNVVTSAIFINFLNPKLSIFFLAFLPQFISANDPAPAARMVALSAVFILMTLIVFVFYAVFAARMRRHILSRPGVLLWIRRGFAAGFVGLGIKLALSQR
ncbi:LysE family translocator [Affinibrenneria salicis]|uniref:LysE family translocator n=1 Tax=Affinibrenneria salicis TaxID=2590031 RepID=A0A5J5G4E7_9GAMM|nr:LysE family translocator [Affinibrenneria salicis]KAA9001927.1 LysE family translocator [Affinibrenneria salicis]